MDQLGKAASADPQALHFVSEGEEIMGVFSCSAGEAADGNICLLGLGFCFFSIKLDSVSFFN